MGLMGKLKEAQATAREHVQYDTHLGGVWLASGNVTFTGDDRKAYKRTAAGVTAEYESGAEIGGRTTLTRVAAGAVLAGPVGAIVGGMFKKDRNKVYVSVVFPDGTLVIADAPAKDDAKAREFARRINAAGQHYM